MISESTAVSLPIALIVGAGTIVFGVGVAWASVTRTVERMKTDLECNIRDTALMKSTVAATVLTDERMKSDIDRLGRKVNDADAKATVLFKDAGDKAAKRYHNLSMAVIHSAPPAKEKSITELLKEN